MPEGLSLRLSSWPDNLLTVDRMLANVVSNASEYCAELKKAAIAGDDKRGQNYFIFLKCAMLTFGTYRNEIAERNLDSHMFPRTNEEVQLALQLIAAARTSLLLAMEKQREELEEGRAVQ